jgi:hypothetical protein
MEWAKKNFLMVIITKDNMLMDYLKVLVNIHGKMAVIIREILSKD